MVGLTQMKSKGTGNLVGGNSMCKGPEVGLLDKLKEGDRKPVWLEDSRCGGEWWKMRLEWQKHIVTGHAASVRSLDFIPVMTSRIGFPKAEPETRVWCRSLLGRWFQVVEMKLWKYFWRKSIYMLMEGNRWALGITEVGAAGPLRSEQGVSQKFSSEGWGSSTFIHPLPFPLAEGGPWALSLAHLHFCTGWAGSGSLHVGPGAESRRHWTHSCDEQLWPRVSLSAEEDHWNKMQTQGPLAPVRSLGQSLSRRGPSNMQVQWHLSSCAHKGNKNVLSAYSMYQFWELYINFL